MYTDNSKKARQQKFLAWQVYIGLAKSPLHGKCCLINNSVAATMIFTCHTKRFVAATCRGDVSQRFVATCVSALKFPVLIHKIGFICQVYTVEYCWLHYILLTKGEGRTGRISARGLDSTDRAQRGPCKKDRGPIFSQYGPEQAWLIRDLLYD